MLGALVAHQLSVCPLQQWPRYESSLWPFAASLPPFFTPELSVIPHCPLYNINTDQA